MSDQGFPLIGIDPSMTLTYRSEYPKYIQSVSAPKVQLIQEWLQSQKDHISQFKDQSPNGKVKYKLMPHCTEQSNAAHAIKDWQTVFSSLGRELQVLNLGCCGMSGTYGHESRNKENSQKIYSLSWQKPVQEFGATGQLVATGYSCRSQVKRESKMNIRHPVQVLLDVVSSRKKATLTSE